MAILLWHRDVTGDVNSIKTTFSSWDSCMTKTYCKWPAIIGIIIVSLIVLSLLSCIFRCLCCGVECCCGCFSCFNRCCPSPRRRRNNGYQQQLPPQPQLYYQQPPPQAYQPMMYGAGGYSRGGGGAQSAVFDAPSSSSKSRAHYNEDALPAMPGWDSAATRHVEDHGNDDVEMENLRHPQAAQHQTLLPQSSRDAYDTAYYGGGGRHDVGDLGDRHASPYQDYGEGHARQQQQQYASLPIRTAYHTNAYEQYTPSPVSAPNYSNVYKPQQQQQPWSQQPPQQGYVASAPPSYHTSPVERRPVQGSWRDV